MTRPSALAVSRMALRLALIFNAIFGVVLCGVMILSIGVGGIFLAMDGFGEVKPADAAILAVMTVNTVAIVRLTHLVLKRLIEIIDTVRGGEPFALANAGRLRQIAWKLLGIECLAVFGTFLFGQLDIKLPVEVDMPWTISFGMLIAVPLLLVLSRVFDEGARMRASLEVPA